MGPSFFIMGKTGGLEQMGSASFPQMVPLSLEFLHQEPTSALTI